MPQEPSQMRLPIQGWIPLLVGPAHNISFLEVLDTLTPESARSTCSGVITGSLANVTATPRQRGPAIKALEKTTALRQ